MTAASQQASQVPAKPARLPKAPSVMHKALGDFCLPDNSNSAFQKMHVWLLSCQYSTRRVGFVTSDFS